MTKYFKSTYEDRGFKVETGYSDFGDKEYIRILTKDITLEDIFD